MSVYCAAADCKYNNNRNRCTAKRINLSWHSAMTLHEGRQEFLRCKNYEMSEESKEIAEKIRQMMEGK